MRPLGRLLRMQVRNKGRLSYAVHCNVCHMYYGVGISFVSDGILVPGGFGIRGVEGKVAAARYARENRRPYLGLCLGMQV